MPSTRRQVIAVCFAFMPVSCLADGRLGAAAAHPRGLAGISEMDMDTLLGEDCFGDGCGGGSNALSLVQNAATFVRMQYTRKQVGAPTAQAHGETPAAAQPRSDTAAAPADAVPPELDARGADDEPAVSLMQTGVHYQHRGTRGGRVAAMAVGADGEVTGGHGAKVPTASTHMSVSADGHMQLIEPAMGADEAKRASNLAMAVDLV
eukprot:CAMPEP_0179291974 /NCGR_PEP_ID=MMETSP0797-20121207/42614_1 /TAXON_ID=47934 /ORGANISM="Dinophysis acuminata, Strain DAEP01" /LENGTH=205 /DNA_ID=CAMNT_0021001067 /DNA_START=40 /DNA_END=658 /DNA_ORIENTATION=-